MSADLTLYSPREKFISREELRLQLERVGYFVVFSDSEYRILPDGELQDDWLLASRARDRVSAIQAALRERDQTTLEYLSSRSELLSCGLTVGRAEEQPEDIALAVADLKKIGQMKAAEAVIHAKTIYRLNVSARCTTATWKFFEKTWRVLGSAAGGLLEDPQSGELVLIEEGRSVTLVPPRGCLSIALDITEFLLRSIGMMRIYRLLRRLRSRHAR